MVSATPDTTAVYPPGARVTTRAESREFPLRANAPTRTPSADTAPAEGPLFQSSLVAIVVVEPDGNIWSWGSIRGEVMPNSLSDSPTALIRQRRGESPVMTKPPINRPSPVPTGVRVERLVSFPSLLAASRWSSVNTTRLTLSVELIAAVLGPVERVASRAASAPPSDRRPSWNVANTVLGSTKLRKMCGSACWRLSAGRSLGSAPSRVLGATQESSKAGGVPFWGGHC